MPFTVKRYGKELDPCFYSWDEKNSVFSTEENDLVLDFYGGKGIRFKTGYGCHFQAGSNCSFKTGPCCTFKTGSNCTFNTGDSCTFNTGDSCNFETGDYCIFETGGGCNFKTCSNCTFKTCSNCTFKTGDKCKFITGDSCSFDIGSSCTLEKCKCSIIRCGISIPFVKEDADFEASFCDKCLEDDENDKDKEIRMKTLELFVATFNGGLFGGESYFEAIPNVPESSRDSIKSKLFDVVKEHGFQCSRKNPKKISVNVESIYIKDGKLARKFYVNYEIEAPIVKMTSSEFNEEREILLKDVPLAFHKFLSIIALEDEVKGRFEKAISELTGFIIDFKQALHNYQKIKDS